MWRCAPLPVRHDARAGTRLSAVQTRPGASPASSTGVPANADPAVAQHDDAWHRAATSSVWCVESSTAVPPRPRNELAEAQPLLRIQAGRGLVEDQQLRVAEQRLGQRDAPAHAAGQGADRLPARRRGRPGASTRRTSSWRARADVISLRIAM